MADGYTIRPFEEADLPEVLEVMRASLGETTVNRRSREAFAWKHLDNPFGRSIVLLADSGGEIAGLRAFMRWDMRSPTGALVRCVRPVDTATHPAHRRKGIFEALTMAALEVARNDGVHLVFNTPNPQSGAGYRKMGWSDVGPIGVMVRPRRPWRPATVPDDADRRGFVDVHLAAPLPDIDDRPALGLRTVRTTAYRKWRFETHPTAGYRTVGYPGGVVVLRPNVRSGRGEVVVSDLIGTPSPSAFRAAARASDAHYLVTWFSAGSPERAAAWRGGFVSAPRMVALTQVALPLGELDVDVFDPGSWDLAMGDLELL